MASVDKEYLQQNNGQLCTEFFVLEHAPVPKPSVEILSKNAHLNMWSILSRWSNTVALWRMLAKFVSLPRSLILENPTAQSAEKEDEARLVYPAILALNWFFLANACKLPGRLEVCLEQALKIVPQARSARFWPCAGLHMLVRSSSKRRGPNCRKWKCYGTHGSSESYKAVNESLKNETHSKIIVVQSFWKIRR